MYSSEQSSVSRDLLAHFLVLLLRDIYPLQLLLTCFRSFYMTILRSFVCWRAAQIGCVLPSFGVFWPSALWYSITTLLAFSYASTCSLSWCSKASPDLHVTFGLLVAD
nr:hypothetical protein Iba_chr09bCG0660 [Ipomoea batatas]